MRLAKQHSILLYFILFLSGVALTACGQAEASDEAIKAAWQESAHADAEARAFTRWNDDDPAEIPANCAKCHSTPGYHDFLGADGSTPGQVDEPAPVGTTVECEACHNDVSLEKDSATMPSAAKLNGLGRNADCMECHQGRASGVQVNEAIAGLPADTVNKEISAPSVHNSPVGPTQYGSIALGGYEYQGKSYANRYGHVIEFDTCIDCHSPHSLKIDAQRCSVCHLGLETAEDFGHIRTSNIDYDGDRDTTEGIAGEVETMQEKLLLAIDRYTAETEGVETLVISGRFVNEAGDSYSTWTPRLLQAAYNYQYNTLGAAAYAHHPHYTMQLLYDSIEDMGGSLSGMTRPGEAK